MSRDRQLRLARVLGIGIAIMALLMGSMAEDLKDPNTVEWLWLCGSRAAGREPLSVRLWCVWRTPEVWFNVEM